ncbi:hypothetical protein Tco_0527087 [Tanacetum coccineum]
MDINDPLDWSPLPEDFFDDISTLLGDDDHNADFAIDDPAIIHAGNTVLGHEQNINAAANQAAALVIDTYNQHHHQFDVFDMQHLGSSHGPAGPASGLANVPMTAFGGGGSGVIQQGTMMPAAAGGVMEQGMMMPAAAAAPGASGSQARRTSRITRGCFFSS